MTNIDFLNEYTNFKKEPFVNSKITGVLYIDEIFVFFNEPQVFTCKNIFGHLYIMTYADSSIEISTWLGNPISYSALDQLKRKKIDLFSILTMPEDGSGTILKVEKNHITGENNLLSIVIENVELDILPDPGYFLNIEIESLPNIISVSPDEASKIRRDIISLSISNETHKKEIEAYVLGSILKDFQTSITLLAYTGKSLRGKIPEKVKREAIIETDGFAAASFGVYLKSSEISDIVGCTPISEALCNLSKLITISTEVAEIKNFMKDRNPRAAASLVRILKILLANNLELSFELATPDKRYYCTNINLESINNRINNLTKVVEESSEKINMTGVLTAFDSNINTFTFSPESGEEQISGKVMFEISEPLTVPAKYTIEVIARLMLNDSTGYSKVNYEMIDAIERET